jgi:hypothetical protein
MLFRIHFKEKYPPTQEIWDVSDGCFSDHQPCRVTVTNKSGSSVVKNTSFAKIMDKVYSKSRNQDFLKDEKWQEKCLGKTEMFIEGTWQEFVIREEMRTISFRVSKSKVNSAIEAVRNLFGNDSLVEE